MKDKVIQLLNEILRDVPRRNVNISKFIKIVEDNEDSINGEFWTTADELANTLNFYEPDPAFREEDPALFGNEKLESEVRRVLEKLTEII